MINIKIKGGIQNTSLQVGDYIYIVGGGTLSTVEGQIQKSSSTNATRLGKLTAINNNDTLFIRNPEISSQNVHGSFLMFSKDKAANNTSLIGYYANVKLVNDSIDDAELFVLASEVAISSK